MTEKELLREQKRQLKELLKEQKKQRIKVREKLQPNEIRRKKVLNKIYQLNSFMKKYKKSILILEKETESEVKFDNIFGDYTPIIKKNYIKLGIAKAKNTKEFDVVKTEKHVNKQIKKIKEVTGSKPNKNTVIKSLVLGACYDSFESEGETYHLNNTDDMYGALTILVRDFEWHLGVSTGQSIEIIRSMKKLLLEKKGINITDDILDQIKWQA